jgi:hypothetical protein
MSGAGRARSTFLGNSLTKRSRRGISTRLDGGGVVVAEGTPESIASSNTATGKFLAKALKTQSSKSAKVTRKVTSKVTSEALDKVKRASRKKVLGD